MWLIGKWTAPEYIQNVAGTNLQSLTDCYTYKSQECIIIHFISVDILEFYQTFSFNLPALKAEFSLLDFQVYSKTWL